MTNDKKAKEKWHQAYLFRKVGMKESYLILRNAWFTSNILIEECNMLFLMDDWLEE